MFCSAFPALASLRISQCRTEEAGAIIEAVFHRVKAIRDKVSARTIIEELTGVEESDECKGANKITVTACGCHCDRDS